MTSILLSIVKFFELWLYSNRKVNVRWTKNDKIYCNKYAVHRRQISQVTKFWRQLLTLVTAFKITQCLKETMKLLDLFNWMTYNIRGEMFALWGYRSRRYVFAALLSFPFPVRVVAIKFQSSTSRAALVDKLTCRRLIYYELLCKNLQINSLKLNFFSLIYTIRKILVCQ